ncbi:MAG: sigma-70 family RNA polymerase sigma factor [Phycisphaera sp.]|nr:sigma-70 family RNA polymerase sigma factor [Phycisphaera sp.]
MEQSADINDRERLTRYWLDAEPAVQAYVFAVVREVHDAEDVVQQVALTVARRFDEYDDTRPFLAWALWLARSRIADHFRKTGRDRLVFSPTMLERFERALSENHQVAVRREALEHCLGKLPEKPRRLIELRYENDASMQSVADAMESTAASVRVMLFRVRNQLAECVNAQLAKEAT